MKKLDNMGELECVHVRVANSETGHNYAVDVYTERTSGKQDHILQAVMLLLGELGREDLAKVQGKVNDLLQ